MTAHLRPTDVAHSPDLDHQLSPHTGYARAHWEAAADRLLSALLPYASPNMAQYRLPGRPSHSGAWSDGLEGYARSFLLAAYRIAGASGTDLPGDTAIGDLIERYAVGLAAGTDPRHPERWPLIEDRSQPMVEASSVAIALHETRPWIWEKLPDAVRGQVVDWLGKFVGAEVNDSNWRLFQVVTEEFLCSVGAPHSRAEIDTGLARLEDWYRGGGWYTDGDGRKFDYYNAWALHVYPALWARIAGPRADPELVARHRDRLKEFLNAYQHFFGSDGAPVHQGRSLIYRYTATAPLWIGALTDSTPLSPGLTRRLASGALKHFAEHEVPDGNGLLSLGWYRPFLPLAQPYSGPNSPYWSAMAFLGLLLPPEHPVWTAREAPSPVETSDRILAMPAPGWLLHSSASDGIVRLINHGSDHLPPPPFPSRSDPHYSRLAYSSATAPEIAAENEAEDPDNHVALVTSNGRPSQRGRINPLYAEGSQAASWHAPILPADSALTLIATASVVRGPWEVRVHRVEAPRGTTMRERGWSVACDVEPAATSTSAGFALAQTRSGLASALVALHGWDDNGPCEESVTRSENRNAYGHHSATPTLTTTHPGGVHWIATLVVLTADPTTTDAINAWRTGAGVHATDETVVIEFPDRTVEQIEKSRLSPS